MRKAWDGKRRPSESGWLEHRSRLGSAGHGPEAAQADRALETCDGKSNDPSWSDVLDRFIEYSREVNGVCTSAPNMTEHTFEEGLTRTDIRASGGEGQEQDALPRREETGARQRHAPGVERGRDNRVIKLEWTPGLDKNATCTWEEERYPSKIRSRRTRWKR